MYTLVYYVHDFWWVFCLFFSMEDSPFGPLTQRLVSAFLEENLMTPMDDIITDLGGMSECVFACRYVCVFVRRGWGEHFHHYHVILTLWMCDMNVSWMSAVLCVTIFSSACSEYATAWTLLASVFWLLALCLVTRKHIFQIKVNKSCCSFLCYDTTRRGKVTYKTLPLGKRKVLTKKKKKKKKTPMHLD